MNKEEVRKQLNDIFANVLNRPGIELSDNMTTDDIDNWDSLTNMTIISDIEHRFNIHFKLRDIIRMKNVGGMIDAILKKTNE
jgi:acyl carrier protein